MDILSSAGPSSLNGSPPQRSPPGSHNSKRLFLIILDLNAVFPFPVPHLSHWSIRTPIRLHILYLAILFHSPLCSLGLVNGLPLPSSWIQSMKGRWTGDQAMYSPSSLPAGWWPCSLLRLLMGSCALSSRNCPPPCFFNTKEVTAPWCCQLLPASPPLVGFV